MEFQEAMVRLIVQNNNKSRTNTKGNGKGKGKGKGLKGSSVFEKDDQQIDQKQQQINKWKVVSFRRSSSAKPKQEIPKEFLCPISESLMNDPVIVSSGHTFERSCVQACKTLGFIPLLIDANVPDFSTVIPNLALKSAIVSWCNRHSLDPPKPIDFFSAEKIVRAKMVDTQQCEEASEEQEQKEEKETTSFKLSRCPTHLSSSSVESLDSTRALQSTTRPSCYSSGSSLSDIEAQTINAEEEEMIATLKSPQVFEIEEALISIRKMTRTKEETRTQLCTPRLLSALRSLITSRYIDIQVNSVACLVNLSLEKSNKVMIVRSGIVPPLIDVLKGGFPEAQEHACGAIFSLALDDHNKTAIGVLGALPPLVHLLRSNSEWTRHDSALALYHLSLVQINRSKLVKLGAVPILLGMIKSGHMRSRVLLILCNLASCLDGRAAMLDSSGVDCLVGMLRDCELESGSTQESCVSVLYALSQSGLRFKGLAKAAGAIEVLEQLEKSGREQSRGKVREILEMMKGNEEQEEVDEPNWEELLNLGSKSRTLSRPGDSKSESSDNISEV